MKKRSRSERNNKFKNVWISNNELKDEYGKKQHNKGYMEARKTYGRSNEMQSARKTIK
jgi:ribosomal protein L28